MKTGADLCCEALEALGVECAFGLPGTQNVSLFEGLRLSSIRTVVPTHELAAGFMANGYARATGGLGVFCGIPGPGFTYALPALAEARHDSAAVLFLTGVPEGGRPFSLQALDQAAMASPVAKAVLRATIPDEVGPVVLRAGMLAKEGEPGPVVVEVSDRILGVPTTAGLLPGLAAADPVEPPADVWDELSQMLGRARRPFLLAGQGSADAATSLALLAERLHAPLAATLSARGVLPEDHELVVDLDTNDAGLEALNSLIAKSDLVLACGCKLTYNGTAGFRLRLPPDRLVHVDLGPGVLNANYPCRLAVRADVPRLLARLSQLPLQRSEWKNDEFAACRPGGGTDHPAEPSIHGVSPSTPAAFFRALGSAMPRDAMLVLDSGLHQQLARRYHRVLTPRGLLAPSDFQSMGFGIPAAIGAALSAPRRSIVALVGDGGFVASGLDLATAVRERVPLTVIVFVDGALGLIRQQQVREFGHAHGTEVASLDLRSFADAVGADYLAFAGPEGAAALRVAIASDRVTLVEVAVGGSVDFAWLHAKGAAKAAVRRVVPRNLLERLKRVLK